MMKRKKSGPHITEGPMIRWLRVTEGGAQCDFSFHFIVKMDVRDCEDPGKSPAAPRPGEYPQ